MLVIPPLTIGIESLPAGLMLRGVNNGDEREAGGKAKEFGDSLNTREGSTSERHRGCLDPALSSKARLRDDWVNLCKAPTGIGLLPEIGVLLPWNPATIPSSLGKVCDSGEEQGVIIMSGAADIRLPLSEVFVWLVLVAAELLCVLPSDSVPTELPLTDRGDD